MIDNDTQVATKASARRWGAAAALVAAGLAGGLVLAGTVTANAATSTPSPTASATAGTDDSTTHGTGGGPGSGETALTGTTADKVEAAVLAKYPGATIERLETDSDGVYEAHIVTTDEKHLVVAVDAAFAVTGAQEMTGGPGGKGGGPGNGETALTGTTADKVEAAVLAKYPGATIERLETDSDGVYEAHIVTTDEKHLVVAVDAAFAVTGAQEMTGGPGGKGGGPGNGETALTGTTADKVEAAVLAKYPDATIKRLETDSDGVYEAHIVTTDEKHLVVAVDAAFAVTGAQEMTGGPGRGHGHGPDAGSATPDSSSTSGATASSTSPATA